MTEQTKSPQTTHPATSSPPPPPSKPAEPQAIYIVEGTRSIRHQPPRAGSSSGHKKG